MRLCPVSLSLGYRKGDDEGIVRGVCTVSIWWPPIRGIEESWLYQEYHQKGWAVGFAEGFARARAEAYLEQAREDVPRFGRKKLGPPSEVVFNEIGRIDDLDQLMALLVRVLDISSRDELLAQTD